MNTKTEVAATPPKLVEPAAYNKFVGHALLRDVRLIKSEFFIEPEAVKFKPDWKITQNCDIHDINFSSERDLLLIWVGADAICKVKNKRVVSTRCRYLVVYDIHGEPQEDVVNAFAKRVARFAAYPYFRAHFAELTSQAGVPLPPLPVLKEIKHIPNLPMVSENNGAVAAIGQDGAGVTITATTKTGEQ